MGTGQGTQPAGAYSRHPDTFALVGSFAVARQAIGLDVAGTGQGTQPAGAYSRHSGAFGSVPVRFVLSLHLCARDGEVALVLQRRSIADR